MTKLYLARHGETLQNRLNRARIWPTPELVLNPAYDQLTERGISQAKTLGSYVRSATDAENVLFMTSDLGRSIQTAEFAARECNLELSAKNHCISELLGECGPADFVRDVVAPAGQGWQDYARNAAALLIAFSIKHKKDIVAPLHGVLNMCLLRWFGEEVDLSYLDENCQVHVCSRNCLTYAVEEYVPFSKLTQ